jgi:hypothetical protein
VYLPYTMSRHHWQRHTSSSSSSSSQHLTSATAISRAQHLSSLLSGPRLGALPEFVAALDELTYPVQRLNAWKAVWGPLVNSVADKAHAQLPQELVRLWQEEIYPDLVRQHKPPGGSGAHDATQIMCPLLLLRSQSSATTFVSVDRYSMQPLSNPVERQGSHNMHGG